MVVNEYKLNKGFGLDIAVLADAHDMPAKKILPYVREIAPKVICLVGDMVHHSPLDKSENTRELLRECVKIAPTLYVFGNHDYFMADGDVDKIKNAGVIVLDNSDVSLFGVRFGGFPSLRHQGKRKKPESLLWLDKFGRKDGYKVLLCHHPEYYDRYDLGKHADLILSGHVHGGHIRIFGRGVFSSGQGLFPKYTKGLYHDKMIVSAGLADTGGVFPRVNNEAEILHVSI